MWFCGCAGVHILPRLHFKVKEFLSRFPAVMIDLIDGVFQTVVRIKILSLCNCKKEQNSY